MSRPHVPPKVTIHLLGGRGSGRSTFMRRYYLGKYQPYYNPLCHEDVLTSVRTVAGMSVTVSLDNETPTWYSRDAEHDNPQGDPTPLIEAPDAMLMVINPAYPPSIDGALKARLDHYERAISDGAGVLDSVVIVKDVGMSWEIPTGPYSDEGEAVSLNLSPQELELDEREWWEGAERGYELARRLGVEATVACSRTGEGVKKAVEDLVIRVLEKRRVDEARALEKWRADETRRVEEERRRRDEELLAAMPWWKRPLGKVKARRGRRGGDNSCYN